MLTREISLKLQIKDEYFKAEPRITEVNLWQLKYGENGIKIKRDENGNLISITQIKKPTKYLSKSRIDIIIKKNII